MYNIKYINKIIIIITIIIIYIKFNTLNSDKYIYIDIYQSIEQDDMLSVGYFIENGYDLKYHNNNINLYPLYLAIKNNMIELSEYLIKNGADVNYIPKRKQCGYIYI